MTNEIRHEARAFAPSSLAADDAGLRLPPDPAVYRGAPMPFLAGNCVAHPEAVAACRGALASVLEGLQ